MRKITGVLKEIRSWFKTTNWNYIWQSLGAIEALLAVALGLESVAAIAVLVTAAEILPVLIAVALVFDVVFRSDAEEGFEFAA